MVFMKKQLNRFLKIGFWVLYFNALLVHYFLLLLNRRRMKGKAWENFRRFYMCLMVFREGKKLTFGFGILVMSFNALIVHTLHFFCLFFHILQKRRRRIRRKGE